MWIAITFLRISLLTGSYSYAVYRWCSEGSKKKVEGKKSIPLFSSRFGIVVVFVDSRGNGRNFSFLVRSFNIFLSTPNDSIGSCSQILLFSLQCSSARGEKSWLPEISYHFILFVLFPFYIPLEAKYSFRNKIGNLISINATHSQERRLDCCSPSFAGQTQSKRKRK